MALVVKEEHRFSCTDDEEDALLKEAISCNTILDLKVEDEEDESVKTKEESENIINNGNTAADTNKNKSNSPETNESSNGSDTSDDTMETKVMNNIKNSELFSPSRKRLREGDDNYENENEFRVTRNRRNSNSSGSTMSSNSKSTEYETDPSVLARRQKDIDYGKNTIGYDRYTNEIPKDQRTKDHPRTPPMYTKYSRRGWDGMVKLWRKQLHFWDPDEAKEIKEEIDF